ncbi:MAG: type II secretion system protein [Parcubacteria group bacterium]|nr:type II secretion system protein [Parcubacteria group bacterium]
MNRKQQYGFTLIETLVAVSLLVIAIAGPMSLAAQSLSSAFYARDQMTAFHLAQEAIEAVRFVRDGNILINNVAGTPVVDLLAGIPDTTGKPFTVDIRYDDPAQSMALCNGGIGPCDPLQTNGTLFGYQNGWQTTRFTRSVRATLVGGTVDEVKVQVEVRWRSGAFQERVFTMSENMHRWLPDTTSP